MNVYRRQQAPSFFNFPYTPVHVRSCPVAYVRKSSLASLTNWWKGISLWFRHFPVFYISLDYFQYQVQSYISCYSRSFILLNITAGSVFITSSPQSILNARLGSCVVFECKLNSETVYPSWSINQTDYPITDLPLGHAFKSESYTGQLIVGPLNRRMNNTVYYCYVVTLNGREESAHAHLIITKTNPENTHLSKLLYT